MRTTWSAALSVSILLISVPAAAGWSVGIPGVISVGSNGVRAGSEAQGTNIPTPNCGGDICNALEKGKKDITGQAEKEKQEREYNEAVAEFDRVQKSLNEVNKQIDDLNQSAAKEAESFKAYKARQLEGTRKFNQFYDDYRREYDGLDHKIAEAQKQLKQIRAESLAITKSATTAASQLKPLVESVTQIPVSDQSTAGIAVAEVVKMKGDTRDVVAAAVASFQKIATELGSGLKKSYLTVLGLTGNNLTQGYFEAMDHLSESLKRMRASAADIMKSVGESKQQNDQMAAQINATQD